MFIDLLITHHLLNKKQYRPGLIPTRVIFIRTDVYLKSNFSHCVEGKVYLTQYLGFHIKISEYEYIGNIN